MQKTRILFVSRSALAQKSEPFVLITLSLYVPISITITESASSRISTYILQCLSTLGEALPFIVESFGVVAACM